MTRGDDMAYRMFHQAYFDRLLRYLLVTTAGDEHAARDALQDTFTRVVRHVRVFPTEAAFWSWLTVLARSALFDAHRKRSRYRAFIDRFRRQAEINFAPADVTRDDLHLEGLLGRNLALLPAAERELLAWKYTERHTVADIAARLGTTEKAVEARLGRIRRKLKRAVLAGLNHES